MWVVAVPPGSGERSRAGSQGKNVPRPPGHRSRRTPSHSSPTPPDPITPTRGPALGDRTHTSPTRDDAPTEARDDRVAELLTHDCRVDGRHLRRRSVGLCRPLAASRARPERLGHTNSSYRDSAARLPPYSPREPPTGPRDRAEAGDRGVLVPLLAWAGRARRQWADITAVLDLLHNQWATGA